MESAEWIFTNHKLLQSTLQLLKEKKTLLETKESTEAERDAEIGGIALKSPILDGMPHAHTNSSSTEWAVIKLNDTDFNHQALSQEILRYEQLLHLYEAIMHLFNEKERWFVENYYDNNHSMTSMVSMESSPFKNLSRATMSNYKKRLLQKASEFLKHLHSINC